MIPNLWRFIAIYRGYERPFWISQGMLALATLFTLLIPLMTQSLIDDGILQKNQDATIQYVLWMVLFAVLSSIFTISNTWYAVQFAERTAHAVRMRLYTKIQELSVGNLERLSTSDLMVRMVSDVNAIKLTVQIVIVSLGQSPVMLIGALILIYLNSPGLMWILLIAIPLILLILVFYTLKTSLLFKIRQQALDRLNKVLQENLTGVRVVKAFVRRNYENRRFDSTNQELRRATLHPMQYTAFLQPSLLLVISLATAAGLWFGEVLFTQGNITVGQILAFTQYLINILIPLIVLVVIAPQVIAAEASAGRMFEVLDTVRDVPEPSHPQPIDPATVKGRIVFENVSFQYWTDNNEFDSKMAVLKHINLIIEPGQTVAFLGATGSGKSTLVNLIPRLYDANEGSISIDGVDVRDIPLTTLRQIVGIALQETILFSGTVRENICYGQPDATDDVMVTAAKTADAHKFICAIPEGYDAKVTRQGTNFSGGQRQRLSIARALTVQPKVLILDDSTSALDMATEAHIQNAIKDLMAEKTVVYVAQRISTVIAADKIFVLDGGEIIAEGTHTQLLQTSRLYQEIYDSQLGGA